MINFAMMLNLNEAKSQSSSLFNSSSKVSNLNEKSEFENVMIKKESVFDKGTNKNSGDLNKSLKEKIEDLEKELSDDYTREDLINIVNLYLTIDLINNNNFKLDCINFINFNNKFNLEESITLKENTLGIFELKDGVLSVPILSNSENNLDKLKKIESKMEDKNAENNIIFIDNINKNNEDIKVQKFMEFNNVEELIREFENISKINMQDKNIDYIEVFEKIESIINSREIEGNSKFSIHKILKSEELILPKLEVLNRFNGETEGLVKLNEKFNAETIEFKDVYNMNNNLQSEINKFSNFLLSQRVSSMKVDAKNMNDKDLDVLIDIIDSEQNSSINNLISSDVYSFKSNINDTIKANNIPESIRQTFLEKDITQTIQYMRNSNINELTLKVKPKELGEVTVNLVKNNSVSDVVITVEREELFNAIKKNLIIINKELKDLGLKIDNISIEIKPNSTTNSTFNFMSNSQEDNSRNQNYQRDKNLKKDINATNSIEVSDIKMSKNEVENEVNILA